MATDKETLTNKHFKSYLIFWSGQKISILGSSIVSFIIIWYITITTGSPLLLAVAGFLGIGSTLLVQPFAGTLVDRSRRKGIIFLTDFGQALMTIIIIALFAAGRLEIVHIFVLLTFRGVFQGFQQPAVNAIIPLMVPRDKLARMNSINFFVGGISNLLAPAIAAILLAVVGLENLHYLMLIDTSTFVIAVIPLAFITIPELFEKGQKPKSSFKADFAEGLSFLKRTPGMFPLLSTFGVMNFFLTPTFILLPYLVSAPFIFNSGEVLLATSMVVFQIAAIIVSITLTKRNPTNNLINGVSKGIYFALLSVSILGVAGIYRSIPLLFVAMGLMGLSIPYANVFSQTIWQKHVPPELQGRVMSVRIALSSLISPVAIMLVGFVSESFNPSYLFAGFGIFGILFYFVAWMTTDMRHIETGIQSSQAEYNKPKGTPAQV